MGEQSQHYSHANDPKNGSAIHTEMPNVSHRKARRTKRGKFAAHQKPQRWQAEPQCTREEIYSLNDLVRRRTVVCHIPLFLALRSAFFAGITLKMTVIDNAQCKNVHAPKTPTIIIINNRKTFLLSTHLVLEEQASAGLCSRVHAFLVFLFIRSLDSVPVAIFIPSSYLLYRTLCSMRILQYKDLQRIEKKRKEKKNETKKSYAPTKTKRCTQWKPLLLNQTHKLNKWVHRRIYVFN